MNRIHRTLLAASAVFLLTPLFHAQVSASSITRQFDKLRTLPTDQRSVGIIKLAVDIQGLRANKDKVDYADDLAHLVAVGDQGDEARKAVAETLSQALAESPQPSRKDQPAMAYLDLARMVRYENVNVNMNDPLLAQATQILAATDAEIEKADFTLKDLKGKKYTLSELRGKIVLINFWATSCKACQEEMPNLDVIYTHYQSQGLVILSITSEAPFKVARFINSADYHPPVLIDTNGVVANQFHISTGYHPAVQIVAGGKNTKQFQNEETDGVPKSFVFDREGKLAAQSIDECTQRQFFEMLAAAGLHP
jgi:peroxiredoxin